MQMTAADRRMHRVELAVILLPSIAAGLIGLAFGVVITLVVLP